jgi:pilus assembly protein Flp/PilA
MLAYFQKLTRRDEDGASAVEYGLLVAGIAALIVAVVFLFGGMISNVFSNTCNKIKSSASLSTTCS